MTRTRIVVPCFEEAQRLDGEALSGLVSREPGTDLLLVDDGSQDDTLAMLRAVAARNPDRVEVLALARNVGKAEAVRQGILQALDRPDTAYVGYFDADLSTPLSAVADLRGVLEADAALQMVFGSRVLMAGHHIERVALRHYLGRIWATVASYLVDFAMYDTQCGAKLFRASPWVHSVFATPFVSDWLFDFEIVIRWISLSQEDDRPRARDVVVEYPLAEWVHRGGGAVGPAAYFHAFADLVRLHRHYYPATRAAAETPARGPEAEEPPQC